jgi:cobyrinic acid a,c-diamide synthase
LGLVPGGEQVDSDALIAQMTAAVAARFDIDAIAAMGRAATTRAGALTTLVGGAPAALVGAPAAGAAAASIGEHPGASRDLAAHRVAPRRPILAVARDEAFCFYYPENLELLAEEGAEVEFFSPLRGERPSPQAAGVYLGGGYPELHGEALASNTALWQAMKDMHAADKPIYAECGGFMVLTQGLTDASGHTWKMAGLLPGVARMNGRLAALGYRHVTALRPNLLAVPGESLRGHEFRYSSWVADASSAAVLSPQAASSVTAAWNPTPAWEVKGTRGKVPEDGVGYARGNLLASYLHVHFGQRRDLAQRFVSRLR